MKLRILPFMAISFALLLAGRAAVVSSTVANMESNDTTQPVNNKKTGSHPEATSAIEIPNQTNSANLNTSQQSHCLTGEIASILRNDMKVLDSRKTKIEIREATLLSLETKLAEQLKTVEEANAILDARISTLKGYANEDISHLVKMYETMKAKQAAEIFNSMTPAFAAGFLREMNSDKAGMIMASMDPRKSYAISVIMAGRNSSYRE